jgi:menaquinone biosynthesis decarboxylase
MHGHRNLREFIGHLRAAGEVVDVTHEVDPYLEIAEIHRRVAAHNGPALFFHNVKGSSFPVVTNLFGSERRVALAFPNKPELIVENLIKLATSEFPPNLGTLWKKRDLLKTLLHIGTKKGSRGAVKQVKMASVDLEKLPLLQIWPEDGGHFVTLPLVYTEPVEKGPPNLGMYRIQRYDKTTTGLHFQIAKGGGFHYGQAERKKKNLPVNIFVGGPPSLMLAAISPLPENVSELLLCSLLQDSKVNTCRCDETSYPLLSECEFALVGHAKPYERRLEGPFGDHYGYYSLEHDFPVFHCDAIYHRKDAIYPATVVGKPVQEDMYIGNYLQKLLSPLFPVVMPGVKDLWSYGETGFHSLSAAVVKERYYRESMASAFRILGEGQLALTKTLLLTDQNVPLQNFKLLLTTILERFKPQTDLFIFSNLSLDTLDYTGPALNKGSRAIFLGMGDPIRDLPEEYRGSCPRPLTAISPYAPGCLILEAPNFNEFQDFSHLLEHPDFQQWPMLVLVDDIKKALFSDSSFMWTLFTRFEPAADIHARSTEVLRHHLSYTGPILIDARMKPSYPKEVLADDKTHAQVTKNWSKYFPQGMSMGDSLRAHVC